MDCFLLYGLYTQGIQLLVKHLVGIDRMECLVHTTYNPVVLHNSLAVRSFEKNLKSSSYFKHPRVYGCHLPRRLLDLSSFLHLNFFFYFKKAVLQFYLTQVHDNALVDLLPQMGSEYLDEGDFQCRDLAVHEDSGQIQLYLETYVHLGPEKEINPIIKGMVSRRGTQVITLYCCNILNRIFLHRNF